MMPPHILASSSERAVALKFTNLAQLDTFRIQPAEAEPKGTEEGEKMEVVQTAQRKEWTYIQGNKREDSVQRLALALAKPFRPVFFQKKTERDQVMENFFGRLAKMANERFEHKLLHQHAHWRSALEVLVRHEVCALLGESSDSPHGIYAHEDESADTEEQITLFEELISQKWEAFARTYHFIWNMFPHMIILGLYMCLLVLRVPFFYQERFDADFPGTWKVPGSIANHVTFLSWFCPVVFCVSIPFLAFKAYQEARLTAVDLDPNEDSNLSFQEILIFGYKNLGSLLNCAASGAMIVQAYIFAQTWNISKLRSAGDSMISSEAMAFWHRESEIMAFVSLMLWCKLLHLLVPLKMAGSMLIIVWRMILSDMSKFFSVYLLILGAFSVSSYVLVINYYVQEGIPEMDEGNGDDTDFIGFIIR